MDSGGIEACKRGPGRLQSRQERIERRVLVSDLKVVTLLHAFDIRTNNMVSAVGQRAVRDASMALLLATH
jgi:hypothetical protein